MRPPSFPSTPMPTRHRPRCLRRLGFAALALGLGCGPSGPSIVGRWEGIDSDQGKQTFVFETGGAGKWALEYADKSQTFDLRYELDRSATPHHLDLTGFASGPLAGQALYCLAEVGAEELKIDCRPGEPGASGETRRPTAFTDQAIRCKRVG